MIFSEELGLSSLAALGTLGSVCAVLLRSTHHNLKTLDTLRREATAAAEQLRRELRDHDDAIFKLQAMCTEYRLTIAQLEADLLQRTSMDHSSSERPSLESSNSLSASMETRQTPQPPAENHKTKPKPEDVI